MSATTDYMNPYNDGYNIFNQFDRILFIPKHPLLQSELNELQSGQQDQQRWIANWSMNNGTILAGMGLQNQGYSSGNAVPDSTNPNLFSTKNLTSNTKYNDLIITTGDNYTDHGEIDVTSDATDDSQPLEMNISYPMPSHAQYITMSFDLCETGSTDDGELENIGLELANGTSVSEATIDGRILKNGELEDDAGYNLTDTTNDMIDLSDGNYHKVVITMDTSKVGSNTNSFNLILNAGYPSVSEGCNVAFDHFKIEEGTEPTTWELNSNDIPTGSDKRNNKVLISSGFVYLDGYVRHFKAQTINIKGKGFEKIGLHLTREVISGATDNAIDDHTQGTDTYGVAGADRERYHLTLSYSDNESGTTHDTVIYYLYNGKVIAKANWNRDEKFEDTLAKRTYETNGSFLAKGLDMYAHPNLYDPELINLQFTPGVAYVLGHRIQKDGSDVLSIPTERETMRTEEYRMLLPIKHPSDDPNAPKFHDIPFENPYIRPEYEANPADNNEYTGGVKVVDDTNSPQMFHIDIDYGMPSKIEYLLSPAQSYDSDEDESFNSDNNQVLLDYNSYVIDPKQPSVRYYQNYTKNMTTGQTKSVKNFITASDPDSNLQGNQILWENQDSPFDSGDSAEICAYTRVTYRPYNSAFEYQSDENGTPTPDTQQTPSETTNDPDYYLIKHNGKYYISFNQCDKDLDITGAAHQPGVRLSGITPTVDNGDQEVDITYFTYLARKDLITLDRNGHFYDVQGDPNIQGRVMPPANKSRGDNLTLNIGYVTVMPNQQVVHTQMSTIPKVPFTNINDMRLELATLKYNMSVLAANQTSMSYVDPVTLVDIFSDFFTTTDKANITDENFNILFNTAPYITPKYNAEGYLPLVCNKPLANDQNTLTMPRLTGENGQYNEDTNYLNQDHASTASLPLNNYGLRANIGNIVCDPEYINDKLTTEQIDEPTTTEVMDNASAANYLMNHEASGSNYNVLYTDGQKAMNVDYDPTGDLIGNFPPDGEELQNHTTISKMYGRAYIAPQFVHISGTGFIPNSTHYSVYIPTENYLHLNVTPYPSAGDSSTFNSIDNNYGQGVDPQNYNADLPGADNPHGYPKGVQSDKLGTVNADANGNISCWFKIPKGQVRAMEQTIVLANDTGSFGTDTIDAIEAQPVKYNHTDDVVVDNYDLINKNSVIASTATSSLSASASTEASYLGSYAVSLSESTYDDTVSLSTVESYDTSSLNSDVGSMNVSMDAITAAEQEDSETIASLTDTVYNFDSYVVDVFQQQASLNSNMLSNINNLYDSTGSLYMDHIETEDQLGDMRTSMDNLTEEEEATATNLNSAINQTNANFSNVDNWENAANTQMTNNAQSIASNNQYISTTRQQTNQVANKLWLYGARTPRQLMHDEADPGFMQLGSHSQGWNNWCQKFNMDPNLISIVKNSMTKVGGSLWQSWENDSDGQLSQTQGGLWVHGTEIVKPGEKANARGIQAVSNRLQAVGLNNNKSPFYFPSNPFKGKLIPVNYISMGKKHHKKHHRK